MQTILKCDDVITCANIMITIKNFAVSSKINYVYIALSQSKFILPDLSITVNLFQYENTLCFLCKDKKASHNSFYKDE